MRAEAVVLAAVVSGIAGLEPVAGSGVANWLSTLPWAQGGVAVEWSTLLLADWLSGSCEVGATSTAAADVVPQAQVIVRSGSDVMIESDKRVLGKEVMKVGWWAVRT